MECNCPIEGLSAESYLYDAMESNMYIVTTKVGGPEAVIVDPCVSADALLSLKEFGAKHVWLMVTHEHFDHISGIGYFREHFNCSVIASRECASAMSDPKQNLSAYFGRVPIHLFGAQEETLVDVSPFSCEADIIFDGSLTVSALGHSFDLASTPGHSRGSVCILLDGVCLFSGDSLLPFPVQTRLPGGSVEMYTKETLPMLSALPAGIIVYPGHGRSGLIEEMCFDVDGGMLANERASIASGKRHK